MSRQACRVVSALASVMGVRFEHVALQLLPQLFKMVVITVQVRCTACSALSVSQLWSAPSQGELTLEASMFVRRQQYVSGLHCFLLSQVIAESAEAAVAAVMHSCRGSQLAGRLCDALCRDRSAKLRLCCADWLLQARFF